MAKIDLKMKNMGNQPFGERNVMTVGGGGMWAYPHTPQAMETVCRFPFPKHLVEECVDLS